MTPPTIPHCHGNVFTDSLPISDRRDTHTDWWKGFMKYEVVSESSRTVVETPSVKEDERGGQGHTSESLLH
jgi:hypothetical protein